MRRQRGKTSVAPTKPGKIVIISSPSGGGKTSICRSLLSPARRRLGWTFSVSYTTRRPRKGERNGNQYFFVDDQDFMARIRAKEFAEHFKVHLYRYGTPRSPIDKVLKQGGVMVLDVDVQGAFRLKKLFPQAITLFILPPSVTALKRRLKQRGTETRQQLQVRFDNARKEMKLYRKFEYAVVNEDLRTAVNQVLSIVEGHSCRTENLDAEHIRKIIGLKG
ncbi:MAG: guanylate kinase [Candidatus Zixiibacteriota bacterium]